MLTLFESQNIIGLVLMLVGIGLIIMEMLMPGFGLPGITGGIAMVMGIVFVAQTLTQALLLLLIITVVLALLFFVLLRSVSKGRLSRSRIVLRDAVEETGGYDAFLKTEDLLGKVGTALSLLRPSGVGEFDNQRLDIVSEGAFVPAGTAIRIVRVQGRQIMVEAILDAPTNRKES